MPFFTHIKHNTPPMDSLKLLRTAGDEVELSMLRGLLEDADIPLYLRDRDSSSTLRLYTGQTPYGTDVFVDERDFDRANELVQAYLSADAVIVEDGQEPDDDGEEKNGEPESADEPQTESRRPPLEHMRSGTDRAVGTVTAVVWGVAALVVIAALIIALLVGHPAT